MSNITYMPTMRRTRLDAMQLAVAKSRLDFSVEPTKMDHVRSFPTAVRAYNFVIGGGETWINLETWLLLYYLQLKSQSPPATQLAGGWPVSLPSLDHIRVKYGTASYEAFLKIYASSEVANS